MTTADPNPAHRELNTAEASYVLDDALGQIGIRSDTGLLGLEADGETITVKLNAFGAGKLAGVLERRKSDA